MNHRLYRLAGAPLLWLAFLLLIGLAGCRPAPAGPTAVAQIATPPNQNAPEPEPATAVPSPTAAATASATAALPAAPAATTGSAAAPTATAQPEPTPAAAPPLPASGMQCGLMLPLVSPPNAPPTTVIHGRLDPTLNIPENARPALTYLLENPADVGLVAYRVGAEAGGIYLNPDTPMPLASVAKIIHLVAYAQAVVDGRLNPADWVPVTELDRYYLQGSDLRSHPQAIQELRSRGLVSSSPQAAPMEELPWMMMRNSSNAATDYLHLLLGQRVIEETAVALGLTNQTAPCPFLGQFLTISNHTRLEDNEAAIQALIADPAVYGQLVMDLTLAYSEDAAFREAEGRWYQRARRPSWAAQSLFSENLSAQGSARDYADLLAAIAQNQIDDPYTSFLIRRNLEWPLEIYPINQELFYNVGYKNGSLPGILNSAYYAAPRNGGGLVVVTLFYRNLPEAIYQDWRRNLYHDDLARWLLTDPQAIPALRAVLSE
jgi:D-alanyl-D-alanine carboxypeptidase